MPDRVAETSWGLANVLEVHHTSPTAAEAVCSEQKRATHITFFTAECLARLLMCLAELICCCAAGDRPARHWQEAWQL